MYLTQPMGSLEGACIPPLKTVVQNIYTLQICVTDSILAVPLMGLFVYKGTVVVV